MPLAARILVLWEHPHDSEMFDRHYADVHIPLARKLPGLRRYTVSRNPAPAPGAEHVYLVAEFDWDDLESLKMAFSSPEGRAVADDVAILETYATVNSVTYELDDCLDMASSNQPD